MSHPKCSGFVVVGHVAFKGLNASSVAFRYFSAQEIVKVLNNTVVISLHALNCII